jgi:signal transduction histidine kinase
LTYYAIQIGSALEMLLLAIALADSMRIEREKHERSQAMTLADSLALQKVLQRNQLALETKVQHRAKNIHQTLSKVQSAFKTYMRFGAMISHEFKNPLNAIINQIETLKIEKQHGIDETDKRFNAIESQAARLKNLFEHWLSTDRLISGQLSADFRSISLNTWLQDALDLIKAIHPDREFRFNTSETEDADVQMDTTLVQVAFFNLVDNACLYSKAETPIWLSVRQQHNQLEIQVRNQPIKPMTKALLEECLDSYQSLPHSHYRGTGLGLSLVSLICEVHKGQLLNDLDAEQRVVFTMVLPVIDKR